MLFWASTFFVLALLSAFLGFYGLSALAATISKVLFFVFLALFIISLLRNFFAKVKT